MSLVSNAFFLFTLAAVLAYYLVPARVKWIVLLLFSCLYYLSGNARYFLFLLYSVCVTWLSALWISRLQEKDAPTNVQKLVLTAGLICNLGMLGVVKYAGFIADNVCRLFSLPPSGLQILLPLGISFYTFQSSGYLLDVYWKKTEAQKNPFQYALFVSFFPQLLQGPIGNFGRLMPQLTQPHTFDMRSFTRGLERILWGYAKKIIIADWAGVFADAIWGDLDRFGGLGLIALLFYGIQLYADFSGAMDVVIGIASLFGITLDENFRRPYLAVSMADFWKRWHISLGEWMMNYVFYPVSLSGAMMRFSGWCRKKFGRKQGRVVPIALADLIVFFLVGIWHGASWKYVIYGLLNGGIIAFSELMDGTYRNMKKAFHISGKETWYRLFTIIRTFILVNLRWFFDRSDTLTQAFYMIRQSFTHFRPSLLMQIPAGSLGTAYVPWALLTIMAGCIVMVGIGILEEKGVDVRQKLSDTLPSPVVFGIFLALFAAIGLFGCSAAPRGFIYAQF